MKKFYLLFCFLIFIQVVQAQQINLINEENNSISLSFEMTEWNQNVVLTGSGDAMIPVCNEGTPMLRSGSPDVPKVTTSLVVDDHNAMEIEVVSSHYTEISNFLIAPSKGNLLRTVDPATVPYVFGEAYTADEFYPGNLAMLDEAYVQHNLRGQALHFFPFQYNPVTKVLRVYDHIDVQVINSGQPGFNQVPAGASTEVNALFNDVFKDRFINYAQVSDRYDQVGEIGNLLVISHESYMDELAPWIQWKKEKGIPTELVDVADIIAEAGNDVTNIDNYVTNYYNNNGLTYLVLVGDEDQVPTLMVNNSGGQGYCDQCYGYINGNDHYAELFISRLIVHTETELPPIIDKILEYEKSPYMAADWFSIAVGIGSNEGDGFGDDNQADWEHQNGIKEDLLGFTYSKVYELYDGNHTAVSPTGGETADGSGAPSSSTLSSLINTGCSLINYTGHGSHTSIVTSSYTNNQINALTNQHRFPYFIIVGCCVGDFDDDDASGDTFGEAWLKSLDGTEPAGGIGGAFSSVYQSWSPPMEGQDEMNNVIVEMAQAENTRHTLGSIHVHGCASMNDEYGGGGDEMTDTWHLFGDATVQLRTAMPSSMTVDHPATSFMGVSELDVDCDTEGAMVGLTIDGEIIGMGIIENGTVNIGFEPIITPSTILVTVTSFNTIPYQGTVDVVVANGPYVIDENETIDDVMGNNNGLADYNESVYLDITLNNVGIETAFGVTATISTTDPAVNITDNSHNYGDIMDGETPLADNGFAFDVADGVVDQHIVEFNMLIEDQDGNIWEMDFNVVLNAPSFVCFADMSIDDSNGNNNGRIDSGETVMIQVGVDNNGHADSEASQITLSTSSPYLTISDPLADGGDIIVGNQSVVSFEVIAAASIPDGTTTTFDVNTTAGMYSTDCSYETILDIIMEDWETGSTGNFPWELAGDSDWFPTTQEAYEGTYSMQSGDIGNGDNTILKLEITVLEASDITFSAKVSSEAQYDFLNFKIDNTQLNEWSGELPWTVFTYPVTPGLHTFRWTYLKDAFCCQEGEDAAWVDDIILPPYDSSIDINELMNGDNAVHLFPNPANESLSVEFSLAEAGITEIEVLDATGRIVLSTIPAFKSSGSHKINLNTSDLAAGVYVLKVHNGKTAQNARLIIR